MKQFLVSVSMLVLAALSLAQSPQSGAKSVDFNREVLAKMGVDQLLGNSVPADVPFTDEHGRQIKIGDLFGKRPIVIMPMYFECQGVCGVETDSLLQDAIHMQPSVGQDYDIVLLSINPKETPALTMPRWKSTVDLYNRPSGQDGFHFLTGTYENIRKVTDALGFKWVYDAKEDAINHPAGLMVLSPTGKITGYLVNNEFPQTFLEHLLQDARAEKVGPKTQSELFGCIKVDKATGHRSLVIENVIRLCCAAFAVGVACWITGMSLSERRSRAKGGPA